MMITIRAIHTVLGSLVSESLLPWSFVTRSILTQVPNLWSLVATDHMFTDNMSIVSAESSSVSAASLLLLALCAFR